jgi:hypothetical protein
MNPFCSTRKAILVWMLATEKPGLSLATKKPWPASDASSGAQSALRSASLVADPLLLAVTDPVMLRHVRLPAES